jgi:hypothetical protein
LLLLRFYGDLSGNDRQGLLVAAGYVGTDAKWDSFGVEWLRALREAKVKEFHATDFFSCHGEFEGWELGSKKHVRFAKRFTAIAESYGGVGVVCGLPVAAFREHLAPVFGTMRTPHNRFTPKMLVTARLLSTVYRNLCGRGVQVAAIFEQEDGMGEVIDYFNFLKKHKEPWTDMFVSFATADKALHPLQGADLLAHEGWRHCNAVANKTGREVRKSFKRLLANNRLDVELIDPDFLREAIPHISAWVAEHPEGLVYPTKKKKREPQ